MSTLTINNIAIQTYPTQTYCYSGRWDCEDSVHKCPGRCGYVRYKDEYGNIVEESGYCITDTNIQIVASEIIQVVGLDTEVCQQNTTVEIYSEQASTDSGTWRVDVLNGDPSVQYRIRGTASFSGTGMSISFKNLNLSMLDTKHTTRTGSLFSVGANGERNGFYTIDGDGISCTLELLDSNNNILSTTAFNN